MALYRLTEPAGESDRNMCWTKRSDSVAATDEEALAGDPPRLLGSKEHDHVGYVVWTPHAPKRDVLHDRLFRLRGDPPRLDRARGHHVDRDSILSELHGGRPAVGLQGRFACPVGHLARETVGSVRTDIDDSPPD